MRNGKLHRPALSPRSRTLSGGARIADGCESTMEPTRLDRWPVTVAFVNDPDGYNIEIIQYHDR